MDPRFRPEGSPQKYLGPSGAGRGDSLDGGQAVHPTTDDGTLEAGATHLDLATGKVWFYDGYGWFPAKTELGRLIEEVQDMHLTVQKNAAITHELLGEIRDALLKIA